MCGTPRLRACSGLVRLVGALRVRERSRTGRHLGPQCRILLIQSSTGRWLEWCKRWFNQTVATASPYVLSKSIRRYLHQGGLVPNLLAHTTLSARNDQPNYWFGRIHHPLQYFQISIHTLAAKCDVLSMLGRLRLRHGV